MSNLATRLRMLSPNDRLALVQREYSPGAYERLFEDLDPGELNQVLGAVWSGLSKDFTPPDFDAWRRYVERERVQQREDERCADLLGSPVYDVAAIWSFFERGDLLVADRAPIFFKRDGGSGGAFVCWLPRAEVQQAILEQQRRRRGVFFSPHRLKEGATSHGGQFAVGPSILSVDWDEKHGQVMPDDFVDRARPHLVVRSGGGTHAHFFLTDEEREAPTVARVNACGRALAEAVGADRNIYRSGSLMRLPWTYHLKNHERPFLLEVLHAG